jgi:thymidylate synthase
MNIEISEEEYRRLVVVDQMMNCDGECTREAFPEEFENVVLPEKEIRHEEYQYLDLLRDVIDNGNVITNDRTGVGTRSKFGGQLKFSLRNNTLPLLTTRRSFFRGATEELLWMLSGSSDSNVLKDKKIHIWDGNTTRKFLDGRNLDYTEGSLGPVYGHNLRYFGAEYKGSDVDYTGQGVDQIQNVLDLIKNDPTSRRITVFNQDVANAEKAVLHACHQNFQFYCNQETNELSCHLYIRSQDLCCGFNLNVAFYSMMTHLFAKMNNMTGGDFIISFGDVHCYSNHIETAKIQLLREPYPFPTVDILKDINSIDDITNMSFEDIRLNDYQYHPPLKYPMAI